MLVIAALLLYAVLLGGPLAHALTRARWVVRLPRTASSVWHACASGVLISLATALVLTAHDVWEHAMVWLFHADKPLVHAAYAGSWYVRGVAEAAMLILLAGATALSAFAVRRSARVRRERDRHRLVADAQGIPGSVEDPSVRVLEHRAPTAFCIPGVRGDSRIVVTTAALDVLSGDQLAATLEHERAHLRLGHHRMTFAADVLSAALGWTGLLRGYAGQVRRLSEMAADDQAAARHGHRAVASALLEMCTANGSAGAPGGMSAMTGPSPAERIRRLISGPSAARRFAPVLALAAAAAILALPVAASVAPAVLLADTAHLTAREPE